VIYVCVVVVSIFLTLAVTCCCLKCRRKKANSRGQKYSRLDSGDLELAGEKL
jgi:heme/copper-type cytochrome/quinol oxidase subunit 2